MLEYNQRLYKGSDFLNFEPIINSKLNTFRKNFGLEKLSVNDVFEFFINNLILRSYQPDSFAITNNIFEQVCVGGQNDTGIDGIAVKINGIFVATKSDVDQIITKNNKINIDFIFIQSKYKNNVDSGEFGKFTDGIIDFLSDQQYEPSNTKIDSWLELKNYICSEDVLIHWESAPKVKLYYAYTGDWTSNIHIEAKFNRTKDSIKQIGLYDTTEIKYLDSFSIKKLCDEVENQFKQVITIIDSLDLNETENVESSRVLFCYATDFMKLLLNDDNDLRKTLFKDNVRDYQGNTEINNDIYNTLATNSESFCLLNNGITIVCKSAIPGNRKISIENPQIVNGCQTCNTLFKAYKDGIDLSKATLIVKLIATENYSITNSIIKGTNRQNVVYDEVFEITREFHKNLEEYINIIQEKLPEENKIYYERRSNQFLDSSVKLHQRANFRMLLQSFISIILQSPHEGFIHESGLLAKYRDNIFVDGQSYKPYYLSILISLKLDTLFKSNYEKYRHFSTYRNQIMCIFVEIALGVVPDVNNTNKIEKYCDDLVKIVLDDTKFTTLIDKSIDAFVEIRDKWIQHNGAQYKSAIKDNPYFSKFMLTLLRGGDPKKIQKGDNETNTFRGTVVTIKKDRNDLFYGYIKKYPNDVFIHEDDNPKINFSDLIGKDVVYCIDGTPTKYNTPRGKIKYVVTNKSS